jgi:hypothetical protein
MSFNMKDVFTYLRESSLKLRVFVVSIELLLEPVFSKTNMISTILSSELLLMPGVGGIIKVDQVKTSVCLFRLVDHISEIDFGEALHELPDVSHLFIVRLDSFVMHEILKSIAFVIVCLKLKWIATEDIQDNLGVVIDIFSASLNGTNEVDVVECAAIDESHMHARPDLLWKDHWHRS